jgi:hypothetical protein
MANQIASAKSQSAQTSKTLVVPVAVALWATWFPARQLAYRNSASYREAATDAALKSKFALFRMAN